MVQSSRLCKRTLKIKLCKMLMSLFKKRKISGLDANELASAYASLRSLRDTIICEESEEGDLNEPLDVGLLDAVLSQLLSRLSGLQVL